MLIQGLGSPTGRQFQQFAQQCLPNLIEEMVTLCQIPSPTFAEADRCAYVRRRFEAIGLEAVRTDSAGNVIGRRRGEGEGPVVLLAAHLDTVFPAGTDLTVRRDGDTLRGPGIGDNCAGIAAAIWTAEALSRLKVRLGGDIIFACTTGEEGLGDLRGMRQIIKDYGHEIDFAIPVDGSLGAMVRQCVGVRRLKLAVTAEGGHSWGAFGAPSAIHALARMITLISELRVPQNPKTTYNIGTIAGGTSINTIAASAEALVDLRSIDPDELRKLETQVRRLVRSTAAENGVNASLEVIGDRPAGSIPDDHPLCQVVRQVHQHLGVQTRVYPSSTDGNIPLSLGIPAVTIGVTVGGNGHRTDEYIYTPPISKGLAQVLLLLIGLQDLERRTR